MSPYRAVVKRIPPPNRHGAPNLDLRLLLQVIKHNKLSNEVCLYKIIKLKDSWYDKFFGTVNLVQVFDGRLKVGDQVNIYLFHLIRCGK